MGAWGVLQRAVGADSQAPFLLYRSLVAAT
jgi:hypothetical protein